ncbi:phosphotransferase [Salsuginibacillus kocurii]|uniref:phosphotransferase n=1 Tax=Salsuginibacillus kocurii TaxID=427078 RepID=UPI00035F59FF|nr:phosphotransferase [Salsuginibacillus kocurii]
MINDHLPTLQRAYHFTETPEIITDRLCRISKNGTTIALKRLKADRLQQKQMLQHLMILKRERVQSGPSVLAAADGSPITRINGHDYMATYWMDSTGSPSADPLPVMMDQLARFHRYSTRQKALDKNMLLSYEKHHAEAIRKWEQTFRFQHEEFSRLYYPSPLARQYMLNYEFLYKALERSKQAYQKWFERICSIEKARRGCLHGYCEEEHLIYTPNEETYFINWERTKIGHPVEDIAQLIRSAVQKRLFYEVNPITWLQFYEERLPLLEEEKWLLLSILYSPVPLFLTLQNSHRLNVSMRKMSVQFEEELLLLTIFHQLNEPSGPPTG